MLEFEPDPKLTLSEVLCDHPMGVDTPEKTRHFLIEAIKLWEGKTHDEKDGISYWMPPLIHHFWETKAISETKKACGLNSDLVTQRVILWGMRKLWDNLPSDLQELYPAEEVLNLRENHILTEEGQAIKRRMFAAGEVTSCDLRLYELLRDTVDLTPKEISAIREGSFFTLAAYEPEQNQYFLRANMDNYWSDIYCKWILTGEDEYREMLGWWFKSRLSSQFAAQQEEADNLSKLSAHDSKTSGYIYVLKTGEHYKIGKSKKTGNRMRQFTTANPLEIEVVMNEGVKNYQDVESTLHRMFKDKRGRGEWFNLSQSDLVRIKLYLQEFQQ